MENWLAEAPGRRSEFPLAVTTGGWELHNKDNKVVVTGTGGFELISALIKFDKEITVLYGLEIYTRLKGAFLETISGANSIETIPLWLHIPAAQIQRIIDPIDEERERFKERLPLDRMFKMLGFQARTVEDIRGLAPAAQATFLYNFCQKVKRGAAKE